MNSFRCEDADMEVLTEDVDAENNNKNCVLHYNCHERQHHCCYYLKVRTCECGQAENRLLTQASSTGLKFPGRQNNVR